MNNDMNNEFEREGKPAEDEARAATDAVYGASPERSAVPAADAADEGAKAFSAPEADALSEPAIPGAPGKTPGDSFHAPDGNAFGAPRPAQTEAGAPGAFQPIQTPGSAPTAPHPVQGVPPRRAEWSNTQSTSAFNGAPGGRPAYAPYQDGRAPGAYGYGTAPQGFQAPRGPQIPQGAQNPQWTQGYVVRDRMQSDPYGHYTPSAPSAGESKPKRGVPVAVVAIICAACVVLSGAAGFAGARLGRQGVSTAYEVKDNDDPASSGGGDNTTVLYRSVSTDSEADNVASVNDVVNAVANSVVEITTEFKSTGFWQYIQSGAGSGVIISENGYIVTNNHVIVNDDGVADTITVRLRDGTTYGAKLVGRDSDADIAVIKIDATDLTAAVFGDSESLEVGEDIVAIGNPLGELGGTVTEGIISALDREVDVEGTKMNLLQFSAAVNPGNSGGGLFNMKGELVGIVNAKSSGSGIEGLGFAIPANDASHIAEELMDHGYVKGKPYLGIQTYFASDEFTAFRYFRSQAIGLYIYDTVEGYNDGVLQKNDRIVEVDGQEIASSEDLSTIVNNAKIGDKLSFVVYRGGSRVEAEVTVYEYVPSDVDFGG